MKTLGTFDNKLEALDFLDTIANVLGEDEKFQGDIVLEGDTIFIDQNSAVQCFLVNYDPESMEYEYDIRLEDEDIIEKLKKNRIIN